MANQVARNNHYVPVWYQRGFMASGQSQLHFLDMAPDQQMLPDGRTFTKKALHKRGPKNCFFEYDLYSTHFGTAVNDEVEKYLFGSIDVRGVKAVRAYVGGDPYAMHHAFQDFFEYLDAQKLRTPKGLDWIKSRYASLDQLQLMLEMQGLRLMHCTMWTEGVREIVSAEESDVKFIVSDHPVTIYNAAMSATGPDCAYPQDPSIELMGTQTVFALDANTCLILTHLEYAQNPDTANLTAPRTHARYRGQSLVRTDAFIRTRKLSRDDVIAVNHLLKSRARRYVAATNKDWLYPEDSFVGRWQDIAKVLLPRDDLWHFGGEIFVGHKDGSTQYQDAYGRTSGAHKYLQRRDRRTNVGPNDRCGCGSGRKFKRCCKNLPEADRPTWDVYGIRERNLMFCNAVRDILGLKLGKTWDDVRRELSDEQVVRIHEAFAGFWPEDTDLVELLPRPAKGKFRALYFGMTDPRTMQATVLGWLPYFDEVVLAHPFLNPLRMKPEYSPTKSPSQHKGQLLKNVLLLLALEPYIHAGHVHLIPDPGDFNPQFGMSTIEMAEQRTANWNPDMTRMGQIEALAKDDHRRALLQLPDNVIRQMLRQGMGKADESQLDDCITYSKSELAADPYALLQPIQPGEAGAQALVYKGYNLESAMYLASLTGSVIYTDGDAYWQQLQLHAQKEQGAGGSPWETVAQSLSIFEFPIDMNSLNILGGLQSGRFSGIRSILRRLEQSVRNPDTQQLPQQIAVQFSNAASAIKVERAGLPDTYRLVGRIELSAPTGGFERNGVRRLLLTFGRAKTVTPIPMAMLITLTDVKQAN